MERGGVSLGNAAETPKVKAGPRANPRWVWKPQSEVLIQEVFSFEGIGREQKNSLEISMWQSHD